MELVSSILKISRLLIYYLENKKKHGRKTGKKIVAKISPKIAKTIAELHQGVCVSVRNARSYQIGSYAWMDVEIIV
jgi:hypothetical protein